MTRVRTFFVVVLALAVAAVLVTVSQVRAFVRRVQGRGGVVTTGPLRDNVSVACRPHSPGGTQNFGSLRVRDAEGAALLGAAPACVACVGRYCRAAAGVLAPQPAIDAGAGGAVCPQGSFCSGGDAAPVECAAGGYWCPAGSRSATTWACGVGYYGTGPNASTYNSSSCAGACTCAAGFYCPAAATEAAPGSVCPFGHFCVGRAAPPAPCTCAPGFSCGPGSAAPEGVWCATAGYSCAGGTAQPVGCTCGAGYYPVLGAVACAGTSVGCVACPESWACVGGAAAPAVALSRRSGCPISLTNPGCKPYVVSIMGIWDEALTLPMSLDSTRHFVDEYIVVHKPGTDNTEEVLQRCITKWGLQVHYIASNMTLRDARMYGLTRSVDYADVYLIQDGDVVFYSNGATAVQNSLPLLYGAGYAGIRSKMVYLKHDLKHTKVDSYKPGAEGKWGGHTANGIMLIDHLTIMRNVPGRVVMPTSISLDVPEMTIGPGIVPHYPWKFDVSIKHPLREFLRRSFLDWSRAGSPGTIEGWAETHDSLHLALVAERRSKSLAETAEHYLQHEATRWLQEYREVCARGGGSLWRRRSVTALPNRVAERGRRSGSNTPMR